MTAIGNVLWIELGANEAGENVIRWAGRLDGLSEENDGGVGASTFFPSLTTGGEFAYSQNTTRGTVMGQIRNQLIADLAEKNIINVNTANVYVPDFTIGL